MKLLKGCLTLMILLGTTLFATAQPLTSAGYKLTVRLENAPFDSLSIFDYTNERNISIPGKKIGDSSWEIIIPDSIVDDSENMALVVTRYDPVSNSSRWIRFLKEKDGEDLVIVNVGVEGKENFIHAAYKTQTTFPDDFIRANINGIDSVVIGDSIFEDFVLTTLDDKSDIAVRTHDPYFSWFIPSQSSDNISYEDDLASYTELAKKFPDSRYLITYLSSNLNNFKSKEDVRHVYANFSNRHKASKWAQYIERYLNTVKFDNTQLPTLVGNSRENIVQDPTKYNLIIFSASWCGPCIAEIPLLKDIHEDLGNELNLTYVSLDDGLGLKSFQKLLEEKEIRWRSVYAFEDINGLKEKYSVTGIPHNILVYPNGDMEVLDVRDEAVLKRLYALLPQNKSE